MSQCAVELVGEQVGVSQIVLRIRLVGSQLGGFLKVRDALGGHPLHQQHDTQVMVGGVICATSVNGFCAVVDDLLLQLLFIAETAAVVVQHLVVVEGESAVELAVVGVEGNQPDQHAVHLKREHAERALLTAILHDVFVLFQVFEGESLVHHAGDKVVEHDVLFEQHHIGLLVVGVVLVQKNIRRFVFLFVHQLLRSRQDICLGLAVSGQSRDAQQEGDHFFHVHSFFNLKQ